MDTNDPFAANFPAPTAERPLLGLTVLVVEDSRYACEAMRLLCLRSGARIRRADCIRSARRHLQVYRPSVVAVDMGLPDGNGADLIAELAQAETEKSVVLATSGDETLEAEAMAAGAQGTTELIFVAGQTLEHDRRDAGIAAEVGACALGVGFRELADHLKAVAGLRGRSFRHEGKGEAERCARAGLASSYETSWFRKSTLKHANGTRGWRAIVACGGTATSTRHP